MTEAMVHDHIDLLSNLPFAVAAAVKFGDVSIETYLDENAIRQVMRETLPLVEWHYDAAQDGPWRFEPDGVELRLASGQKLKHTAKCARGHPDNPKTDAQRHAKFRQCAVIARHPLTRDRASRIIEAVETLEPCENLAHLMELIA